MNSQGMSFYSSMAIIVVSIITYQVLQKNIAINIHPVVSVILSYSVALICSLVLLLFFPIKNGVIAELQKANIATYLIGVAIIGIEVGFLLVYRSGWKLGLAMPFSSSISIIVLTIIGFFFFKEHLTPTKILGIVLCISGILLLYK